MALTMPRGVPGELKRWRGERRGDLLPGSRTRPAKPALSVNCTTQQLGDAKAQHAPRGLSALTKALHTLLPLGIGHLGHAYGAAFARARDALADGRADLAALHGLTAYPLDDTKGT